MKSNIRGISRLTCTLIPSMPHMMICPAYVRQRVATRPLERRPTAHRIKT